MGVNFLKTIGKLYFTLTCLSVNVSVDERIFIITSSSRCGGYHSCTIIIGTASV